MADQTKRVGASYAGVTMPKSHDDHGSLAWLRSLRIRVIEF